MILGDSNSYLKTVSAFANFGTGTILFEVDDDGITVGISDPGKTRLDIENQISDSIRPKPDHSISVILPCVDMKAKITADGWEALGLLNNGIILSRKEIAGKLNWNKTKAIRVLNTLLYAGYIEKIGNGPRTRYLKR